jgi:5-methyltetrahydropteroyltriglutamate--homocysteine methyltransferase
VVGMGFNLTFVGSFPLKKTRENIVRCTEEVLSIPVDYPNYVQLEDMGHQFLQPLVDADLGLTQGSHGYRLTGELKKPTGTVTNEALDILLELSKSRRFKRKVRGVKACITGPFTLASRILLDQPKIGLFGETALTEPEVVERLSEIVAEIAVSYRNKGVEYITVDEPILSIIVGRKLLLNNYTEVGIIGTIDKVFSRVDCLKGIHVCGRISRKLAEMLLETHVDVLDHEFKDSGGNFDVYSREDFERHGKKIGLAASSSRVLRVETVEEMVSVLKRGIEVFGKKNILMVKPDCGFRGLDPEGNLQGIAYAAAIGKLRNLRRAVDFIQAR